MQNACRGFSLPRRKRYARDENIFVSLVTGLDSLDITSETKEQDHMTSKSAFLSCEKILSDFEAGGGNFEFCCFAAMSAVDRGQEMSLSDRYFLLLQATVKGRKVLRAQVAERTEKEEDVNRLTFKL